MKLNLKIYNNHSFKLWNRNIVLILYFFLVFSFKAKADNNSNDQKHLMEQLLKSSEALAFQNADSALRIARELYFLSLDNEEMDLSLKSMIKIAEISWKKDDYKTAMEFAEKSRYLAEELGMQKEYGQSLMTIGCIYIGLRNYDLSLDYLFKSLSIFEEIGEKKDYGITLSHIGRTCFDQRNYSKALQYFTKSYNIALETKDSLSLASGLNNIALIYVSNREYTKAITYLKKALVINKNLNNKNWIGINYFNLAINYQRIQNYDGALDYFNKALDVFIRDKRQVLINQCYIFLGDYYLEIKQSNKAFEFASKSFNYATLIKDSLSLYYASDLLSKLYLMQKDTIKAFKYVVIKNQVKDSLDIGEKNLQMSNLELQYEFRKHEQEYILNNQRKDFIGIIIIISLTLLSIIIFLFFSKQKIRTKNLQLLSEQLSVDLEIKEKELTNSVLVSMKKREILTEISNRLFKIEKETPKDELKSEITKIAKEIQKSIDKKLSEEFDFRFQELHSSFHINLMEKFPNLTSNEQRLCAFLSLNMSTKEILELTGQSINTIEKSRFRLRKKLGINNSQVNLSSFLSQFKKS